MPMTGLDPSRDTADNYRGFARFEAAGRSPTYQVLANAVADDDVVLDFLSTMPVIKRQPNLLFAAARLLLDGVPDIRRLHDLVEQGAADLTAVMLAHRTQTNEVGRCATLLPALARLPEPLALIEVGASAGLVLLLDRYSYDYDGHLLHSPDAQAPVLHCQTRGQVPVPHRVPRVSWRAGLDLNPLDVTNDEDVAWLRCLVWPGQTEREARLDAAIETAGKDPPEVVRGDLLADLPELVARAPADCTVVVFHSAVLAYVDPTTRREFAAATRDLGVRWLSNEGVGVLPDVDVPAHDGAPFVLIEDGSTPLAFTHPHGDWIHWLT
jgi:hypothetical protein